MSIQPLLTAIIFSITYYSKAPKSHEQRERLISPHAHMRTAFARVTYIYVLHTHPGRLKLRLAWKSITARHLSSLSLCGIFRNPSSKSEKRSTDHLRFCTRPTRVYTYVGEREGEPRNQFRRA